MTNTNLDNIPDEMKEHAQWICWKADKRANGKITKIPINPSNGKYAKTNDPETWGKLTDADAFYRSNGMDGIGFVFTENDPFIGIDLDNCIDPETGRIDPHAEQIVKQMGSYTEISPSGRGIHIIAKGELPGGGRNTDKIEIYDAKRYFTITGNLFNASPVTVENRSTELFQLYSQLSKQIDNDSENSLIEKAMNAANGQKFNKLWHGNHQDYSSQSDADLALCRMIAFWTENNPTKIDMYFRQSGLFRKKWDERHFSNGLTYGAATIQKAIKATSDMYHPIHHQTEPKPDSTDFNLTDLGNAERLVHHFGKDIRYCHAWQKWLIWDGVRWSIDKSDQIRQLAKKVIRKIYTEAEKTVDSGKRKAIATHAMKSEAANHIRAMIELAKSDVPITPEELDRDPWLLTCTNGTIDLRTGALLGHQRDHFITQLAPVEYDGNAECPRWHAFLKRVMDGNGNLISFLQQAIGYSLTGENTEQCLFILYGSGANGKSTFLQTLNSMLGDYAKQTPTETLLVKQKGAIPNDVARLKGARFVTASEAESDQKLAESLIKQMTGGDTISARFLHQEWFDFEPTHKVFLGTNHKPVIKGTDHAIWRRIRLIPFEITIPENERDQSLLNKLRDELSGILAWAVRGCSDWQKNGLGIPEEVKSATDTYRGEMDALAEFLNDCCQVDSASKTTSKDIYAAYSTWCEDNGEDPLKQRSFALRLKEKGFKQIRIGASGTRGWRDLRLLT